MLNKVILQGRLTDHPELKFTKNEKAFTDVSIAVEDNRKSGDERTVNFFRIKAWGASAEFICKYFEKGQQIIVDGRLATSSYTDKNDIKRKDVYNAFVSDMEQTVRDWYDKLKAYSGDVYIAETDNLSCPFCGGKIITGKKSRYCSNYNATGCPFSVGYEICGKKIADDQFFKLINDGKTALIKGFQKKDSEKTFDAYLVVDNAEKKVKFEFPEQLCCPICKKRLLKGEYGWFCSGKKDGCSFRISSEICGKKITEAQVQRLCEKGKTTQIKGFKKKNDKGEFDAYLVVDKSEKKIKFEFPPKSNAKH